MPMNKLQKVATADLNFALQLQSPARPNVAGAVVDGTINALYYNPDGTKCRVEDQRGRALAVTSVTTATATISTATSPCIYEFATTTNCTLTLPTAAHAGFEVTCFVTVAAGSGKVHAISPAAADMILFPAGSTGAADKDLLITQGTESVGDYITLRADGTTTWYTVGCKLAATRES
jgi:hypothetical protein